MKQYCLGVLLCLFGGAVLAADPPPLPPGLPGAPGSSPQVVTNLSQNPPVVAPMVPPAPVVPPAQAFSTHTPAPALAPGAARPVAVAATTNHSSAKIQFDAAVFDFGKVMSGEIVKHVYYFTNVGTEDLVVNNVQSTCGCTAVGNDWSRTVKPGASGQIPVQFNTDHFNTAVVKIITVTCNDKAQPFYPLQLKGVVWKPIDVNPSFVSLNVRPDFPFTSASVHITNNLEQPIVLSLPECSIKALGAELKTNVPGRDFICVISNTTAIPAGATPGTPSSVQGLINIKTSATNVPVINIVAWINSQPAMHVVPVRIDLRQAPLATNQLAYVTIINNSTNPITLSEPKVDAKDVPITVTESQPGRYFTIVMNFPPGFELPPGQPATFTVKTSHPEFPLVKVPVYQTARGPAVPPSAQPVLLRRPATGAPVPASPMPQPPRPTTLR